MKRSMQNSIVVLSALVLSACSNPVNHSQDDNQNPKLSCGTSAVRNASNGLCVAKAGQEIIKGLTCEPTVAGTVANIDIAYDSDANTCEFPPIAIDDTDVGTCYVQSIGVMGAVMAGAEPDTSPIVQVMVCSSEEPVDSGSGDASDGVICTADANEFGFPSRCECPQLGAPNMSNDYNPKTGKCEISRY